MTHRLALRLTFFSLAICSGASHASGWMPDGNPIAVAPRNQIDAVVAPDGAGGAIVVWQDSRNSSGEFHSFDIYAQRVDAFGNAMWAPNGVAVCTLPGSDVWPGVVADGFGGAVIVWTRTNGAPGVFWDTYAQRIDGSGNPVWAFDGMPVGANPGFESGTSLISDGAGGGIFAWYSNTDIYVQRINAGGTPLWTAAGLGLCVKPGGQYDPVITTDGAGGAIVAWTDTLTTSGYDIYARRVTAAGTALWSSVGVPLCTAPKYQGDQTIVNDGIGGAVIAWRDARDAPTSRIYLQRVNGSGVAQWALDGIAIDAYKGQQGSASLLKVGANIVVGWWGEYSVYAQRIDVSGAEQWGPGGVAVCTALAGSGPRLVSDGQGGCLMAWSDLRSGGSDVYAQRLDESGVPHWMANGVAVCTAEGTQSLRGIASDGVGGAIATWTDHRSGVDPDVYAHHLGPYGPTLTGVGRTPTPRELKILSTRPNPFGESSVVEVDLKTPSSVRIEMFDVGGQRVRTDAFPARAAGWNRFDLPARDQSGRMLPSGVYFLRISTGLSTATQKIVIAH